MFCPFCRHEDSRVVDSRTADDGTAVRRRRQCTACDRRFTTVETASLTVVKRSGATEPFSRAKVLTGVRKACQGRPVSEDDLARLAQRVEEGVRATGAAEIEAHEVGLAVLGPLREVDEVAYLRYASVYRSYDSLEDFEAEIALLRAEHQLDGVVSGDGDLPDTARSEELRPDPAPTARPSPAPTQHTPRRRPRAGSPGPPSTLNQRGERTTST